MADKKIDQGAGPSAPVEPIRGAEDAPQKPQDVPQAAPVTIPLLTAQDIECRVQSVSRSKGSGRVGAVLLLYKDARVDMRILDQVFGPNNWRRTHEVINGNLFCNIDIWDAQKHDWVRKQDVGVESNTEKEKGQASDAFKRAGFNVGIGRELYTAPFIYVELAENEFYSEGQQNGRKEVLRCYPSTRFTVAKVAYNDRREVCDLVIVDRTGAVRFDMKRKVEGPPRAPQNAAQGGGRSQAQGRPPAAPRGQQSGQGRPSGAPQDSGAKCPICGGPITKAEQDYSLRRYGREACRNCQRTL